MSDSIGATWSRRSRPGSSAGAGEHAVWWHATADALESLAVREADTARAHATRKDAVAARRLARGLALTHTHHITTTAGAAAEAALDVDEVSWP